jgi:hypothetical protein
LLIVTAHDHVVFGVGPLVLLGPYLTVPDGIEDEGPLKVPPDAVATEVIASDAGIRHRAIAILIDFVRNI